MVFLWKKYNIICLYAEIALFAIGFSFVKKIYNSE